MLSSSQAAPQRGAATPKQSPHAPLPKRSSSHLTAAQSALCGLANLRKSWKSAVASPPSSTRTTTQSLLFPPKTAARSAQNILTFASLRCAKMWLKRELSCCLSTPPTTWQTFLPRAFADPNLPSFVKCLVLLTAVSPTRSAKFQNRAGKAPT